MKRLLEPPAIITGCNEANESTAMGHLIFEPFGPPNCSILRQSKVIPLLERN